MADQSLRFLIDANSDQAVSQIKKAVEAVFGLGNATVTVNKEAADAYRQMQAGSTALAGATSAAFARIKAGYDAQRASLDPLFASSQRYEQVLNSVSAALEAQVIDQTQANQVLDMAAQKYLAVGKAASVTARESEVAASGGRNIGFAMQNAAFQIGDFAVQVGAGTSALRAASMQVPQLLGSFGPWGAAIGAAVAVIAALAPALLGAKSAMEEAASANAAFSQSFNALRSDLAEATTLQNEYVAAVKSGNAEVIAAVKAEAMARESLLKLDLIDAGNSQNKAAEALKAQTAEFERLAQQIATTKLDAFGPEKQKEILAPLEEARHELERSRAQYEAISAQTDLLRAKLAANGDVLRSIADGTIDVRRGFDENVKRVTDLAEGIWAAAQEAIGLKEAAPAAGWMTAAMDEVRALIGLLFEARDAMPDVDTKAVRRQIPGGLDAIASGSVQWSGGAWHKPVEATPVRSSGSAGGGGGSNPIEDLRRNGEEAMNAAQLAVQAVDEKVKAGLMTTAEGLRAVVEAKEKTALTLADLIPKMEAIGTPEATRFANAWRTAIGEMSDGLTKAGRELSDSLTGNFENAFASFISGASTGKDAFSSFATSVMNDLAKIAAQRFAAKFISPIFDTMLGGFGFAKGGIPLASGPATAFARGGVPSAPGIEAFANGGVPLPPLQAYGNQVVKSPTFFSMGGTRTGVMGEAGSEAIMPLSRGRDGKLGVVAQGAGGAPVTVNIINQAGAQVTQTTRNENGGSVVDVVINTVKGAMVDDISRGGDLSDALSNSFGLQRRGQ